MTTGRAGPEGFTTGASTWSRLQNVSKTAAESCGAEWSHAELQPARKLLLPRGNRRIGVRRRPLRNYHFDYSSPVHPASLSASLFKNVPKWLRRAGSAREGWFRRRRTRSVTRPQPARRALACRATLGSSLGDGQRERRSRARRRTP